MISVLSTTDKYSVQPGLFEMHRQSLEWLSASVLWKRELSFFQKLLDDNAKKLTSADDKQKIEHFQNLIIYYKGELIDTLRKKVTHHENHLADVLQRLDETDTTYFKNHDGIMQELTAFNQRFQDFKHEFFSFIEKAL